MSEASAENQKLAAQWFTEMNLQGQGWTFEFEGSSSMVLIPDGPNRELKVPENLEQLMNLVVKIPGTSGQVTLPSNLPARTELRFEGGTVVLGSDGPAELSVTGPRGVLTAKGALPSPHFDDFGGTLELKSESEVVGAAGTIGTVKLPGPHPLSTPQLYGNKTRGVSVKRLVATGQDPGDDIGEFDTVSLFDLDLSSLPELSRLRRLDPWWPGEWRIPESRRRALRRAHAMNMSAVDEEGRGAQRALYWGKVSNMLHDKGASGHSQAVARELALDTRRVAAPRWSLERGLLWVSKAFGYGTKVLQPLVLWAAVALIVTLALFILPEADPGVPRPQPVAVWFHLLVSPFQLLRPLADKPALTDIANEGARQQATIFAARAVGTAAFVFSAVAVARLTRVRVSV